MKNSFLLTIALMGMVTTNVWSQKKTKQTLPYQNTSLPIEARVSDLLSRMTLEEKTAQLQCIWSQAKKKIMNEAGQFDEQKALIHFKNGLGQVARPNETFGKDYLSKGLGPRETAELSNRIQKFFIEKTRLGIPVMFHEESLHGNQAKDATNFPSHLALGSSWNEELLGEIYSAIAKEIRARGAQQVLAPVVDLGRDPRWGRTEETLGEDPYHVSRMSVAEIKAYQGDASKTIATDKVVATLKHFGVHGMPENGINIGPSFVDERTLRETYFPSFKACVQEAGVLSVMPCYNELSGIPAHANRWMLQDVLRKEWGFKGLIVSDYFAIQEMHTWHKVAKDTAEAAKLAIEAGVDVETPFNFGYNKLPELIRSGKVSESLLNESVARVLETKFKLGLFDQPYVKAELADGIVGNASHRALALKAAQESMVLLKNDQSLLPIDVNKFKKIAVVGPNADRCILGGYSNEPRQRVTPLQALKERLGNDRVIYAEGVRITDKGDWFSDEVQLANPEANQKRIQEALKACEEAEVILLFLGGNEAIHREAWSNSHMGDLSNLELLAQQNDLIKALKTTGKPIAAFVFSGPPLSFQYLNEQVGSIVQCWYLGQETGNAVCDLILGKINPSGKLSISIPRSAGHIPAYYNHKPTARRGYIFEEVKPMYPFGHGLSYTEFKYSEPQLSKTSIRQNENLEVSLEIHNTGNMAGAEVVQLYIRDVYSSVSRPVKELKDFKKIYLMPGEKQKVIFTLTPNKLGFYNKDMKFIVEPGTFEVMVGSSSEKNQKVTFSVQE